ncbi:MAG: B12-binding domain-containing radical SAM protein [Nitrososphaerales archaeon]|nr:B12-binding domain-containing radical SAM protein [Nitrososphaerales archaeon]
MVKIVLTTDRTLMSEYRHVPLLQFLGCAPTQVPKFIFDYLAPSIPHNDGIVLFAPYSLRKVESALLRSYAQKDIVVVHPNYIHRFIDTDTKIVGISTMDPLGLGPLTMMFTLGGLYTSYTKKAFLDLMYSITRIKRSLNGKFKVVVGGPGAWQIELKREIMKKLGIDHLVLGEVDTVAHKIFNDIENDDADEIIKVSVTNDAESIPCIVNPSMHGMVEVMRGCGRNCEFCDVNLRRVKYFDSKKVVTEILVNVKAGVGRVWAHSEDIFSYKIENRRDFMPNRDAIWNLFEAIMATPGVYHCNPTHGTISPVAADPQMIVKLSKILRAGPNHWIGIQSGLETGSPTLMRKYMPSKAKPFSADEWDEVVYEGTKILNENYWFPAYTIILGLPNETEEDCWDTIRLIDRMEKKLPEELGEKAHFTVTPLSFVPIGALKDKEFFNVSEGLNEARWCVIYRSWRHLALEAEQYLPRILRSNPLQSFILNSLANFGVRIVLWCIKRFGEKLGFDPEKALRVS